MASMVYATQIEKKENGHWSHAPEEDMTYEDEPITMVTSSEDLQRDVSSHSEEDELERSRDSAKYQASSSMPSMLSEFPSMVSQGNSGSEGGSYKPSESERTPTKRGKRKKYQKYTPQDRIAIGKYCFEHGPAAARKAFQPRYPEMSESVTRGFRDKYKQMIGEAAVYEFEQQRRENEIKHRIAPLPRGRPRKYKVAPQPAGMMGASMAASNYDSPSMTTNGIGVPVHSNSIMNNNNHIVVVKPEDKIGSGENIYAEKPVGIAPKSDVIAPRRDDASEDVVYSRRDDHSPKDENSLKSSDGKPSPKRVESSLNEPNDDTRPLIIDEGRPPVTNNETSKPYERQGVILSNTSWKSPSELSPRNDVRSSFLTSPSERPLVISSEEVKQMVRSPSEIPHEEANLNGLHARSNNEEKSGVSSPIIHYPKSQNFEGEEERKPYQLSRYSPPHHERFMNYNPHQREVYQHHEFHQGYHLEHQQPRTKRFKYQKYTPEERFSIGKMCDEIGLNATVKLYREQYPRLNESVVRTFRNRYRELVEQGNGVPETEAIGRKPSKRTSFVAMEEEVAKQLKTFRAARVELSENVVMAVAENIVNAKEPREKADLQKWIAPGWAQSLLERKQLIEPFSQHPETHQKAPANRERCPAEPPACLKCHTRLVCPNQCQ